MDFIVEHLREGDMVFTKVTGELTREGVELIVSEQSKLAKEKDCAKFLTDLSETEVLLDTMDLFETPSIYAKLELPQWGRKAIVYSKDHSQKEFFLNVLSNRGWMVRVFKNLEEAKEWLA